VAVPREQYAQIAMVKTSLRRAIFLCTAIARRVRQRNRSTKLMLQMCYTADSL
jgi:hypothetical protein